MKPYAKVLVLAQSSIQGPALTSPVVDEDQLHLKPQDYDTTGWCVTTVTTKRQQGIIHVIS